MRGICILFSGLQWTEHRSGFAFVSTANRRRSTTAPTPIRRESGKSRSIYQLIRLKGAIEDHTFEIEFLDPGVQAFAFTFG